MCIFLCNNYTINEYYKCVIYPLCSVIWCISILVITLCVCVCVVLCVDVAVYSVQLYALLLVCWCMVDGRWLGGGIQFVFCCFILVMIEYYFEYLISALCMCKKGKAFPYTPCRL